jgi:hypothetical protein
MLKHERVTAGAPLFVALALGGATLGYFLGRGLAPPAVHTARNHTSVIERERASGGLGENKDDDSDAEADGDLGRIHAEPTEECKLVRTLRLSYAMLARILCHYHLWGRAFRFSWYGATLI